jgi:AcrR family transcriptional regulator
MAAAMAERGAGAAAVSTEDVAARTGISGADFDALFADREACLMEAFELGVERAAARMGAAYEVEPRWLDGVKAGLAAFLRFLEDEPALGRLCVVYAGGGGAELQRRRLEVIARLAQVVDRGRLAAPTERQQPPAVIAEGVVGAVLAVVQNRLVAEQESSLIDMFGALISIVVLPYLGAGVARRELIRPAPRLRSEAEAGTPSEDGGTRPTYRTARVLEAIAAYPGASNREVAERAGIVDQGQISKLLGRLAARGLIEKIGEGRTRGAPNSWRLTEAGGGVLQSVSVPQPGPSAVRR